MVILSRREKLIIRSMPVKRCRISHGNPGFALLHTRRGKPGRVELLSYLTKYSIVFFVTSLRAFFPFLKSSTPRPRVILVVDDEAAVRRIARLILERAGYTVLEAPDGLKALELLRTYDGPLDLVISDIAMPHLTGTQLMEHLRVEQPQLKVLLISGQVAESPATGVQLLRKPFTAQALQAAVNALLPPAPETERAQ